MLADSRQVGGNQARVDLLGHIDNEERKYIFGGLDRKVVRLYKGQVRIECGAVVA